MANKKRKREDKEHDQAPDDTHPPLITYHAPNKSFDRLFKEKSLEEAKQLVRHKLKIASDADVGLEQWREGRLIDLEDDDDFAAFGALARTATSLEVRVTVDGQGPSMPISFPTTAPTSRKPKSKKSLSGSVNASEGAVAVPRSVQQQTDDPKLTKTLEKIKKRRKSLSSYTDAEPQPPPPVLQLAASPSSLLAKAKSKSKKRKTPSDDDAVPDHKPKANGNGKAGPSTELVPMPASEEPSTKKRKMDSGEAKNVPSTPKPKPKSMAKLEVKPDIKRKGKNKGKGKERETDAESAQPTVGARMTVNAPESSKEKPNEKENEKEKEKEKEKARSASGGPQVNGHDVPEQKVPTTKEREKKKKRSKDKMSGKVAEASPDADADDDPSAKPKSKRERATTKAPKMPKSKKKADITEAPPAIMAEDDSSAHAVLEKPPARKLSVPTLTWLASLGKEREKETAPVASTSTLPSPPPLPYPLPDLTEPPAKKPKSKKSAAKTVVGPLQAQDTATGGESSSTTVSKKEKTKSKSSKGKDKTQEHEQEQERSDHRMFVENLAGVISKVNTSLSLPTDDGHVGDTDADTTMTLKSKKKKVPKKDLAAAEISGASSSADITLKPKKRRKITATREDADTSVVDEVNVEAEKTKTRSKKRQSEHVESSAPMDIDETSEAVSDVKKTRKKPPRPIISANTDEWDAKIKAVTEAVLARNGPTALSPSSSTAVPFQAPAQSTVTSAPQQETPTDSASEADAETHLPEKRQRSRSKLRMSWGPEDLEQEAAESDAAPHVEPEPAVTRSSPLPLSSPASKISFASSAIPTDKKSVPMGKKRRDSDDLPCPVCLGTPFHLRYRCPVIQAGPDAIEKRLEELKEEDTGHRTLLIEELGHVIRLQRARANMSKSGSSSSPHSWSKYGVDVSPMISTSSSSPVVKHSDVGSSSRKPTIPSGSKMSEVTVENNDEGSSNEGSDDDSSDDEDGDEDSSSERADAYKIPSAFTGAVSLADLDLDALIRGPVSQSKSILDDIPSQSISEDDDEDEAEDDVLEDEDDDDREYRLRSKKLEKTASSEDEGEDPGVLSDGSSGDENGNEKVENIPPEPSAQPAQPLEDTSRAPQVADGSNGSVGIEPMDDDDEERTEVAPSAENGEETDKSGLSIGKQKQALLAAALGDKLPFHQRKDVSKDVGPQPGSPIEDAYPPEDIIMEDKSQEKHDDRSDPIEPADDLMESTPRGEPVGEEGSRCTAVAQSPRKPGMAKRMKTRRGKVLESAVIRVDLEQADQPPESSPLQDARARTQPTEHSPSLDSGTRDSASRPTNVERSGSADTTPAPTVPARRRGRPPLSEDIKAAREKAKADQKALKADEKARKEAAKQAEKAGKAQQRAGKHDVKETGSQKSTSQPHTKGPPIVQPGTPKSAPRDLDLPRSLDKWATINNASSPRVPDTPSVMLDQLRSSSPGPLSSAAGDIYSKETDKQLPIVSPAPEDDQPDPGNAFPDNPLFLLSNSQVPFPYSQWQGDSYAAQAEDTPTESESDDEVAVRPNTALVKSLIAPKFRKLSDIASQAMFSQDFMSPTPLPSTPVISDKPKECDDEEDDESDDSGSDSDTQGRSHIPRSRRAGATLRSKRGGGLLSFA